MEIKANEELFNEIHKILDSMKEHLPSIVQNDMEIDRKELSKFLVNYRSYLNELDDWVVKVKTEIKK